MTYLHLIGVHITFLFSFIFDIQFSIIYYSVLILICQRLIMVILQKIIKTKRQQQWLGCYY